jgi:multiple sugar transport system substrate-binding protein
MSKFYRFTLMLVILVLVMSVTACTPKAEAGPQVVKVLAMQQAGPTPEEMNEIVAKFNEANPDTKVEIEYVSYDALHDKISTAMATTPPAYDVVLVDDIWYAEFAKNGYLWDITDQLDANTKSSVFPAAWDITTVDGKTYGMPWMLDEKYFYYNEKMLTDAGISAPPTTWEEMMEQSQIIKDKGLAEYPMVWSWGQAETVICDFVALLYGNGGAFMDDAGQPAFNNEQGVKTLQWMVDSIDAGLTNPASISYVEEDVRNTFSQGKAAFAINWVYVYEMAALNAEESQVVGQVKMSLIPVFEGNVEPSSSINGSMGFSVIEGSPNREAAWKYVQFLTSQEIQNQYSAHLLPVYSTSYEGDALTSLLALNDSTPVTVPMFKEQFPYSHVRPKVAYYSEGSKALQLAIQEALTKSKTPQQALDDAAAKWIELAK